MTTWEFGLVTESFDAVTAGKKTIEGRLNKGKFAKFAIGDIVEIRKDYRDKNGDIQDGEPNAARVEVVAIRRYPDFAAMVKAEGYKQVAARPASEEDTIAGYEKFYSVEDQAKYGVLAIEVKVIEVGDDAAND